MLVGGKCLRRRGLYFHHGVMKMEVVGSANALVGWYGMVVVAVTRDV